MDPSMVEFGVRLVRDLATKYGFVNNGTTFATHDVPGITRAAIPILKAAGMKAINVGVDRASAVPRVPVCYDAQGNFAYTNECANLASTGRPAFLWRDEASGTELPTMFNPYGYANTNDPWLEKGLNSTVTVPCSSHALALNWRHDNDGPAGVDEIKSTYAFLQQQFPQAKVIASTLDAFAEELQKAKDCLPVITSEVGDTWNYGVPSDPWKVASYRAMARARRQCVNIGKCSLEDYRVYNFSRLLLKNAEHDWGKSGNLLKSDMDGPWANAEFHTALAAGTNNGTSPDCYDPGRETPCYFQDMIDSWVEQRRWGLDYAQQALMDHPLREVISAALEDLTPRWISPDRTEGWVPVGTGEVVQVGNRWEIGASNETGAITHLVDTHSNTVWASAEEPLGEFLYQTFTAYDHNTVFMHEYMSDSSYDPTQNGGHLNGDFGKPGLDKGCPKCEHLNMRPQLVGVWQRPNMTCPAWSVPVNDTSLCTMLLVQMQMSTFVHDDYGAPDRLLLEVAIPMQGARIALSMNLFNKTATRIPESLSVRFVPTALANGTADVAASKLGSWVSPTDVVVNGSRHLHGVDDTGGVGLFSTTASSDTKGKHREILARFIPVDASVSCIGRHPTPYPIPLDTQIKPNMGFAFNLFNNIWNTNYILWYPYLDGDRHMRQRFLLDLDQATATSALPWQ